MNNKYITPGQKINQIIESYPELENFLIELFPELGKIQNPNLKNIIFSTITIDIAAHKAGLNIGKIINLLREKVGQNTMPINNENKPQWANPSTVNRILDAIPMLAQGEHPLSEFMAIANGLNNGETILLITPFLPSPLIEKGIGIGLINWTEKINDELYHNYFLKYS